jgi:hypothetical protein
MPEAEIDAHVHLHNPDSAAGELVGAFRRLTAGRSRQPLRVFVLTEPPMHDAFGRLAPSGRATGDPNAVWMEIDGHSLLLVAGRQLVTAEKLEVLAIGYRGEMGDGEPAEGTIAKVRKAGAIAVLPWGAGKWLGSRGRLVAQLLGTDDRLLLGDNGGRPAAWHSPLLAGRRLLSGSDPLPLPGSWARIGTYGTRVNADMDGCQPWQGLRSAIERHQTALEPFGERPSLIQFISQQAMLRVVR